MLKIRQNNLKTISYGYDAQSGLADALGFTAGYINQLLLGTRPITEKSARKFEIKLRLPEFTLDKPSNDVFESNATYANQLGIASRVPVVGTTQLGDNGHWCDLDYPAGDGDGVIYYPTRDTRAYALRCVGDSMNPRIKNGEFVIVEPGSDYNPGDEVLVKAVDGRVMVKIFLYIRDDYLHLMSINDAHPPQSIAMIDVEKIHYISAIVKKAHWVKDG